jgi:uncharacterized protein YbjT (DUF2867 family)
MKIVVIGGTGLVGGKLVTRLAERHDVVAASPSTGVDARTGEGLSEALEGAAAVVDVSGAPSVVTRNLFAAEATLRVGHHVALCTVRARAPAIEDGGVPLSIVRATLLFECLPTVAAGATDGAEVRLPPAPVQPVAAGDVAAVLARVAIGPPLERAVEVAGPERFMLDALVRAELERCGDPRRVVTDATAQAAGAGPLPGADALLGPTRYADWAA